MGRISIAEAIEYLQSGEPVAFPTETVYGLGADAWNPSAIAKVFAVKGRPSDNPLIVHIASREMLSLFVEHVPPEAERLMQAFWPGPLTLIFKKKTEVLDLITGGLPTVALRWPDHPVAEELISNVGPIVAPSANSSGKPSPTKPEHVLEDFGPSFPVVQAGDTRIGLESTVLDISEEPFRIYRPGFIGKEELAKVLGKKIDVAVVVSERDKVKSPGTKYTHYSPEAEVSWLSDEDLLNSDDTLYLLHSYVPETDSLVRSNIIHYEKDLERMARELYDRFRQADHRGYKRVVIEPFSDAAGTHLPLADALLNRISKAARK
jgi:L-threonylcarbamoyladenylate synthase